MDEPEELRRIAAEGQLRLFTPEALAPIHRLNSSLLVALIEEASEAPGTNRSPVARIGDRLLQTSESVRARLADVPIALVNAGFQLNDRWERLAKGEKPFAQDVGPSSFGPPRAKRLMYQALDAAATAARTSTEHAVLTFGMTPAVARFVSTLSAQEILRLRKPCASWIQPRWSDDLAQWEHLIAAARHDARDDTALPATKYRALGRLLSDIERSATRVASDIRRSRD